MIIIFIMVISLIVILPISLYLNYIRIVKRNHKKKQEEYMKKHPHSYGIGELSL